MKHTADAQREMVVANMDTILEMQGITKSFPGVQALDKVSLKLYRGEILALLGENGAGLVQGGGCGEGVRFCEYLKALLTRFVLRCGM